MYPNQYPQQYSQYNQQYQQYSQNYYPVYNYNQQPTNSYNTPPPTQTGTTYISQNVPVQQPQVSSPNQNVSSLWMGSLEPYMTESFITAAFQKMGEYPKNVKLMRNKNTGETAGYAFVDFYDPVSVMHKLNGKYIPGTNPPVRFKLNHAGNPGKTAASDRDFSVWLGELSSDVDDYQLYKTFACRYQSIRTAKVVLDSAGYSKGYGFIRFGSEEEQKHCLNNMNGFPGLGSKPIKVSSVIPKSERHIVVASNDSQGYKSTQDYGQYFETNYWHRYSMWNQTQGQKCVPKPESISESSNIKTNSNLTLVDYKKTIDIDALNKELISQDYNLWDALESSKWLPLETIEVI
ncbi:tRNA selenocysteine 1-associated protein 1-like [Daktulosphaira vitifoliae]|uniref:tRNA selenocysteine 1-associated protein 1-like n=1 Tax=Daktulosphaira vitifoliae TaxID=58002 RepID=UPI0021AABFCA|nr:tRNA selenocysteine 1-associated protein 1-like [Daktulosphaira vitifoliae]